jgi:hypothetical protein
MLNHASQTIGAIVLTNRKLTITAIMARNIVWSSFAGFAECPTCDNGFVFEIAPWQ